MRVNFYLTMKFFFFGLFLSWLTLLNVQATETHFESGPQQTALVELYTSEGCSSCPPAEAWLSRQKDNPALWRQFVPLAFHVDYWDRLGWRDRFASKQWTDRQYRYAALWQNESVYTPAVVVNGREQRNGANDELVRPNGSKSGLLTVRITDGRNLAIEFKPETGSGSDWEAHAALLGSGISSAIGAGENSGRNLTHDFVVLDLRDAGMKSEAGAFHANLALSEAPKIVPRKAVAVWVSPRGRLMPVQSTGGWLP